MARGRMISTSIAGDIALNELSLEAHLAYLMAIPHLDRDGLLPGHPKLVRGRICPLRDELGVKIADIIQEWIAARLVISYNSDNGPVLFFTGFQKNQNLGTALYGREPKSIFPPPPGYSRNESGLVQESEGDLQAIPESLHEDYMQTTCKPHVEEKRREVEVQVEVKGEVAPAAATPAPQQEMFGAICEAIGWDHRTLSKEDKGQVAQACGILSKANYTVDDIRRFMIEIWFKDWRWEKHGEYPTLKVLRQEIGKLRSTTPGVAPPKETKAMNSLNRLATNIRMVK